MVFIRILFLRKSIVHFNGFLHCSVEGLRGKEKRSWQLKRVARSLERLLTRANNVYTVLGLFLYSVYDLSTFSI